MADLSGRDWSLFLLGQAAGWCGRSELLAHALELDADARDAIDALEAAVRDVGEFRRKRWPSAFDLGIYRLLPYALIRALRPEVFVETGVLHGMSSLFVLRALRANGGGRLVSIDYPSYFETGSRSRDGFEDTLPAGRQPGWMVPAAWRDLWDLRLGKSLELLPPLLAEFDTIDIFVHDSDHTYETMTAEFRLAWAHLRPAGVLVADNINCNDAFADFCKHVDHRPLLVPNAIGEHVDPTAVRFGLIFKSR
jgi:predicted O-methyltransferase YrrM